MTAADLQRELLAQLAQPLTTEALFDGLTDCAFFVKNRRAEYVLVNQELALRCGRREKSELIGRTADQVHPPPLGASYRFQDERVLRTGQPILDQLELHRYHDGRTGWCLTTKLPLAGRDGRVAGVLGLSRDVQAPNESGEGFAQVARAVRYFQANFHRPLTSAGLAAHAGLSAYQFDQRIRRIFRVTTAQFMLKTRMDEAVRRLRAAAEPVAQIAQACGYSDQSAFTRQFRQTAGMTPLQFRKAARTCPDPPLGA